MKPEWAKKLIPILEDEITGLSNQLVSIEGERDAKVKELDELKLSLFGIVDNDVNGKKTRRRKGEADKIIADFIETLPPGGQVSMSQIVERTKVGYASVFRFLKTPKKNKGRFMENEGLWSLAKE